MNKKEFYILFIIFSLISILFHLKSFYVEHNEGDEIVFRTLAEEMNWDLSHYTTMDNKRVREFPSKIYKQPLFFHPPFYPLILKCGQFLGDSVLWGLIFQNVSFILLIGFMCRILFVLKLSRSSVLMALALLVLCPIHLFSTTKLHVDGLLSIYFFCGVTLFVESLIKESLLKSFLSGILLTIALNMKYTVLAMTPILFFVQLYYLYTKIEHGKNYQQVIFDWKNWKHFLIMGIPVLLLGGQHFVRFFLEYGTLSPRRFTTTMEEALAWNRFLATVQSRTRFHSLSYLLAIFPIFIIYLTPPFWIYCKNHYKTKEWDFMYVAISIYLFIIFFTYSFMQLRYLAPIFPFSYLAIILVLEKVSPRVQKYYSGLIIISLFLMSTTGLRNTILLPSSNTIIPSILNYIPLLQKYTNSVFSHYNLGIDYTKKGMLDEAISEYKKSLAINPNFTEAHINLGIVYIKKDRLDDAISEYKKALTINPNLEKVHFNLGNAHHRKGELDKAISAYKQAIAIKPDYEIAHHNLAISYYSKRRYKLAIIHCDKAIELGYSINPKLLELLRPYR